MDHSPVINVQIGALFCYGRWTRIATMEDLLQLRRCGIDEAPDRSGMKIPRMK